MRMKMDGEEGEERKRSKNIGVFVCVARSVMIAMLQTGGLDYAYLM